MPAIAYTLSGTDAQYGSASQSVCFMLILPAYSMLAPRSMLCVDGRAVSGMHKGGGGREGGKGSEKGREECESERAGEAESEGAGKRRAGERGKKRAGERGKESAVRSELMQMLAVLAALASDSPERMAQEQNSHAFPVRDSLVLSSTILSQLSSPY
eukprot:2284650-Rhodomonas_salina.2